MPAAASRPPRVPARPARRVGFHVSVAGGLERAVARADALAADVVQVFPSNPRGWRLPAPDLRDEDQLRQGLAERGIPLFLHAPYLVNVAAPDPAVHARSVDALEFALARGARLGAVAVVVHAGSAREAPRAQGVRRAARTLVDLLGRVEGIDVAVELTAGGGERAVARTPADATELLDAADGHPRLGVCLDTCHLWQAGVDWTVPGALESLRDQVAALGPGRVPLLHVNDAREPLGAGRDHHSAIGDGTIGTDALALLIGAPEWADAPLVLETPGGTARNRADVAAVRALAARAPAARATGRAPGGIRWTPSPTA